MRRIFNIGTLFLFLMSFNSANAADILRLATTTSTENSGLLEYLLPAFEKESGYRVHVIAVGTGKALRLGRDGDVDIVMVHAPGAEAKFVNEGYGVERVPVMYNDFVIVGPESDPANIAGSSSLAEVMQKIARTESSFISRGDDSGTHKKELGLWAKAAIQTNGEWYREVGQGMGKVIQIAGEMEAYTLTDRGTWLAYQDRSPLKVVFEGDKSLFNPYSIMAINPKKYADLNHRGAEALINWITSQKAQTLIGQFRLHGQQLFTPDSSTYVNSKKKKDKAS
jgi:tungstate transport system substrate-binding protein